MGDAGGNESETKPNTIARWLTTHWVALLVGFLGAVASIVGLALALFPSIVAPERELAYCVNPIRTPINQTTKASDIAVTYKGNPAPGNVTAAQIAIWNAGREAIESNDVLAPVILKLPADVTILETNILKVTRDLTHFSANVAGMPKSQVQFDWRILEHNDGALVQVVYGGPVETRITLDGQIKGQRSPREYTRRAQRATPTGMLLLLTGFLACASAIQHLVDRWAERKMNLRQGKAYYFFAKLQAGLIATAFLGALYFYWLAHISLSPFGF
jgi:hypothetical protein